MDMLLFFFYLLLGGEFYFFELKFSLLEGYLGVVRRLVGCLGVSQYFYWLVGGRNYFCLLRMEWIVFVVRRIDEWQLIVFFFVVSQVLFKLFVSFNFRGFVRQIFLYFFLLVCEQRFGQGGWLFKGIRLIGGRVGLEFYVLSFFCTRFLLVVLVVVQLQQRLEEVEGSDF